MSIMHVSSGFAHMLTSNQRGRGHEPVTVLGRIRSFVTVKATRRSLQDFDLNQFARFTCAERLCTISVAHAPDREWEFCYPLLLGSQRLGSRVSGWSARQ